jgi:hypothetical protein
MTRREIEKLRTILAKLEALQNQISDRDIAYRLGVGKSELLRALSDAEAGR